MLDARLGPVSDCGNGDGRLTGWCPGQRGGEGRRLGRSGGVLDRRQINGDRGAGRGGRQPGVYECPCPCHKRQDDDKDREGYEEPLSTPVIVEPRSPKLRTGQGPGGRPVGAGRTGGIRRRKDCGRPRLVAQRYGSLRRRSGRVLSLWSFRRREIGVPCRRGGGAGVDPYGAARCGCHLGTRSAGNCRRIDPLNWVDGLTRALTGIGGWL